MAVGTVSGSGGGEVLELAEDAVETQAAPTTFGAGEPQGGDEEVGGGHESHMVVPSGEGTAFEVGKSETGFQFPVVVLDPPPNPRQADELFQRCVFRQDGEPVVGWCCGRRFLVVVATLRSVRSCSVDHVTARRGYPSRVFSVVGR